MRRPTRAAALVALATILVGACQSGGATSQPSQSAAASAATLPSEAASATPFAGGKVTMWGYPQSMANFGETKGNANLIAAVKKDLNIDLEISLVAQNDLGIKLKAALPAGTGPDLVLTDFDAMNPYWTFAEPLDPYAEKTWGADWRSKFTDSAVTEMQLVSTIGGKPGKALYLPGNMQMLGWVIYSQKLFDQAGVDAASLKTYDDFITACGKLKATPLAIGSHPAGLVDLYQILVEVAAPGQMELAERGKAKFTDPNMVKTFDLIARFFKDCAEPGAIGTDIGQVFPPFFRNERAMSLQFTGTPWFSFVNNPDPQTQKLTRTDLHTFLFPGSKGLAATDAGVAMIASSTNKEAAWQLIKWFTAGPGAEHTAKVQGQPMAWKEFQPPATGSAFDKNLGEPLIAGLLHGDNRFRRVLCADVYTALGTVIPGVVTGQITSGVAAQEVQDAFDRGCQKWVQP